MTHDTPLAYITDVTAFGASFEGANSWLACVTDTAAFGTIFEFGI